MQQTFTLTVNKNEVDKLPWYKVMTELNYTKVESKTEYELGRFTRDGLIVVIYTSGKVVMQGKSATQAIVDEIQKSIHGGDDKVTEKDFIPHIGVDEVGKGDYFGPMVVCAAFVDEAGLELAKKLGVTDSKKLTDAKMLEIYGEMANAVEHEVLVIQPKEYNKIYAKVKNVAVLLAQKHAESIENLLESLENKKIECNEIVIDQFSKRKDRVTSLLGPIAKTKKFTQFHKGESDVAVAVASVFARAVFVLEWQKMEDKYGMKFPKGASNVIEVGKRFYRNNGLDGLDTVAKVSFKTTKSVTS